MDWNQQFVDSLLWLLKVYPVTAIGFAGIVVALTRSTVWGRQFRALAGPYFSPRRSWRPVLTLGLVLLLTLVGVRMNVLLSYWSNGFYSAMQAADAAAFWSLIAVFGVLAGVFVLYQLVAFYVAQGFDIRWRIWLTDRLTVDWLDGQAYYKGQFLEPPVDNPDQRIQVDISTFVTSSRTLSIGAAGAAVSLVAFSGVLWGLSAPLPVFGVVVPRAMVFAVYLYVIVATLIAFRLGRPLIRLNFLNEQLGANFRYALIRVREYAENVAFYRGERVEGGTLARRFALVITNAWAIVFRTLKFSGFNYVVTQGAVIFPYIIQAPRFFSGTIKLGDVMQTGQAFGQVQDALSFFRLAYDEFAAYRATLQRLSGFVSANDEARRLPTVAAAESPDALRIEGLQVRKPDNTPLLDGLALQLAPGQTLLIQGPSGSGKTTLLRTLAGLWPHAAGRVERPLGAQALFLSQRPYLPLGSLRTAVAYPSQESADDDALRTALRQVQLGHLADSLGVDADWSRILSLGEQQRLAFARILLNRPRIAFLDEATSAMDEGLEHALYELLRRELPQCMLVSVGHRSTLNRFHSHRLALAGGGRWGFEALPRAAAADGA